MYNMQAIARRNINNITMQFENLGQISSNLTNINTVGYKKDGFSQILREDGYIDGALRRKVSQGSIRISSNPYDIAVDGVGYIPVVSADGEVQYTRDGQLKKGANGYLMTTDDWMVGDGIKIPANSYKFEIRPNGDVMNYDNAGSLPEKIGTIPLVQFEAPENLKQGHNNKMIYTDESGMPKIVKNTENIKQYALESSNVSVYDEINEMMMINTAFFASKTLIKVADDMYRDSINMNQ